MRKIGKFFLWLIVIVVTLQVAGIVVVFFSRRIRSNTILTLRLAGDIPEQPPQEAVSQLVGGTPLTVTDIVEALDRAKSDPRITALELRASESTMNMGKLQEVRQKILEFRQTGKPTVAYLEFATNRTYYLASSCQTVFLLPKSVLYVRGLMASSTFLRGTLDKLGVRPNLFHVGDYKNAMNVFTERKFTPAHREATLALVEDWSQEFVRGVAEARGLKPEDVQAAVAWGPFTSQEALDARLVDRVAYEDEQRDFLKKKNHGSDTRLRLREYLRRTDSTGEAKIAVIYATGTIVPGRSGESPVGEDFMGSETIAEQFRRAREDNALKAVVLRVDSPGGSAFSSEVIRREVELTRRNKPVVVSMSDVAASGGYWISMTANKIVAEPGTITGSIGVLTGKFNILGLYEKLGFTKDYVALTDNATLDYAFQDFTPAQRELIQKQMRDTYRQFLEGVAAGRSMKVEAVDKIAQGRVWTGERAKQLGLVDELGGLHTALALAKRLAKIPAEEKVAVLYLPPPRSLLDKILDLVEGTRELSPVTTVRAWLRSLETLAREPVWALTPAVPEMQ